MAGSSSGPARILFRASVVLAAVLLVLGVVLTRTGAGRAWILLQVLARVEGAVHGELSVDGVSSPGLLRGFTFRGLSIADSLGRPFVTADSLRAGLSAPALLGGDLVFTRVVVWNPSVTLEQLPDQERLNVLRIFFPEDPDEAPEGEGGVETARADSTGKGRTIALRDVALHGASLDVFLPLSGELSDRSRVLVAEGPDGGASLRRYSFREMELRLDEAVLQDPDREGQRFQVAALSLTGEVWPEAFRITDARGTVERVGSGLTAELEELALPASRARGSVAVEWGEDRGVRVEVDGEARGLALDDLAFLEPRLPAGEARGPFGLVLDDEGVLLEFRETELTSGSARLRADGGLLLGRYLRLRGMELQMEAMEVAVTDPWLPDPLPLRGRLTGRLSLDGGLEALGVDSDLAFLDSLSGASARVMVTGTFHLADTPGVTNLNLTLAPLDWQTLRGLSPAMKLSGPGALRAEASGSMSTGFELSAEATFVPAGFSPSRVTANGFVGTEGAETVLNLTGDLRPLSLTAVARDYPELPVTGEISGVVSLGGPLSDLNLETELETDAGPLMVQARFDARDPARGYNLDTRGEDFLLSRLVPDLPEPTRVTGRILASGRGLRLDSVAGDATVFIRRGQVGELAVDTAAMVLAVEEGLLRLDALVAETELGHVEAGGTFGVSSSAPPGELNVRLESESLTPLRPWIMGEVATVLDELSSFEKDLMVLDGVDLDTLPTAAEVALDGRLQGRASFRGGFESFDVEGSLDFQDLRYTTDFVESGSLTFSAVNLPGADRRIQGLLRTDSVDVRSLSFSGTDVEVEMGSSDGRVRVVSRRREGDEYRARGTFALDTLDGGIVNLDELTFGFDTVQWNLGGPTSFRWNSRGVRVRDFRLIRPGVGFMRIRADGFIPRQGEGDFVLDIERLDLARLARVVQLEERLQGLVDVALTLTGSPDDPRVEGSVAGRNLRYGEIELTRLDSELGYRDQTLTGRVSAREGTRESLSLTGTFPLDLRVDTREPRVPEEPVDLTLQVDSFPAELALSPIRALERVEGTLSGEVRFAGTPRELEPSGELRLVRASADFPALGVRHTDIEATLGLSPDATVEVDGSLRSGGTARVTGTVTLDPLTNPRLDLRVEPRNFLAVNRRDVRASVSGWLDVAERYLRPTATGELTVEEGVLFVEELARSTEVVDLADPAFFDVVDTTLVTLQPIIRASRNPFMQNLRLDVDLSMERGSWLRGKDLNVEMAGQLDVYWDRTERDLALAGDLQAVRGVYAVLGRQFQVQEGTVSFLGTPGINPNLDIEALNRLRTFEGERLDIVASVEGTLLSPRVSLSSNAPFPIAQSDLVSYLLFGRPTYALASGQSSFVQGAAGALLGAATGATANLAMGTLSNELGSLATRDAGLDYLAITQGQDAAPGGTLDLAGTVATTQVEIGQYITPDIFAALMWRPLTGLGGTSRNQFAGLRVEWRLKDEWTLEGFIEDRFARSPLFLTSDLGPQLDRVLGFFFYRQWGY